MQQQHLSEQTHARVAPARTVASQIFRAGGVRLLYRGLSATILRDVGGFGMYFYGVRAPPIFPPIPLIRLSLLVLLFLQYEATLRLCAPVHPAPGEMQETLALAHRSWAALLLAGGAAGVLGWVATFPFDVLKTRMQARLPLLYDTRAQQQQQQAESTWGVARAMYAESGSRVFWRGLAPTLVRAVPVNMAVFGTFESIVWAFS